MKSEADIKIIDNKIKTCSLCGQEKMAIDFTKNALGTYGRTNWCKACHAKRKRIQYSKNKCHYCRKKFNKLTMDHVIPLSKGGEHSASNIVPACLSCNLKKGSKIKTLL